MLISLLNYSLILIIALYSHLYDLFFISHFFELDLLFFLCHLNKNLVRNEGKGDTFITVTTSTANSMYICDRRHVFVLQRLVVVYHQCYCTDVDSTTDCLSAKQYLNLFVSELGYPRGL
jgi:hypothetical protein